MNTNKYFDRQRFINLLKYDWQLNGIKYLIFTIFIFVVGYLFTIIQMKENLSNFFVLNRDMPIYEIRIAPHLYFNIFMFFLLPLGLFIADSFSNFSTKNRLTTFLMLPASSLEKFIMPVLTRIVFGLVLTLIAFWVNANLARISIEDFAFLRPKGIDSFQIQKFTYSFFTNPEYGLKKDMTFIYFMFITMSAYLFAVPLMFRKYSILKTIISFIAVIYLMLVLLVGLSHLFYPETKGFDIYIQRFYVNSNGNYVDLFFGGLTCTTWLILFIFGYYKIKELHL